jgi:exodeoxyribonuclease V
MDNNSILEFLYFSSPTKEQKTVLKAMQEFVKPDNPDDFLILCGAAGTGKTSITAALIGFLNHLNQPYKISAPTGRAARILGRKANTVTSTIHSLIYTPKPDNSTGRVTFKLKLGYNPQMTIYIIDEASMIPSEVDTSDNLFVVERGLIYDLVKFVKGANVHNKIIFLGDHYQLPPVNEQKSLALQKDFLQKTFNFIGSSFILTEVKRQEDGSYILVNATEIREAIDQRKTQQPIRGKRSKSIYEAADNYVKDYKSKGVENSISIGVSHKANKFFNDLVRERIFGKAKQIIEKGDLMLITQNWYRNGVQLYNGDHIKILSVDWNLQEQVAGLHFVAVMVQLLFSEEETVVEDYLLVESLFAPGGKLEHLKENELRKQRYIKNPKFRDSERPEDDRYVGALRLTYGHAITCNKAQGGEWKKVFINTWGIPSLKWQYTAVTRGINEIESY